MKVFDISKFYGETLEEVVTFIKEELRNGLKDLSAAVRALDFSNNFKSFDWQGQINAGGSVTISNALKSVPSNRIITRAIPLAAGTVIIDDTQTTWTKDSVYLRNVGTANAIIRVVFFE